MCAMKPGMLFRVPLFVYSWNGVPGYNLFKLSFFYEKYAHRGLRARGIAQLIC